jgi:hypothetical protein
MKNKYVNRGDAALPKNDFVSDVYRSNPAALQSTIAYQSNQITGIVQHRDDLVTLINSGTLTGIELEDARTTLALAKRTLSLCSEMQAHMKHKYRVLKRERRAAKPIKNY